MFPFHVSLRGKHTHCLINARHFIFSCCAATSRSAEHLRGGASDSVGGDTHIRGGAKNRDKDEAVMIFVHEVTRH